MHVGLRDGLSVLLSAHKVALKPRPSPLRESERCLLVARCLLINQQCPRTRACHHVSAPRGRMCRNEPTDALLCCARPKSRTIGAPIRKKGCGWAPSCHHGAAHRRAAAVERLPTACARAPDPQSRWDWRQERRTSWGGGTRGPVCAWLNRRVLDGCTSGRQAMRDKTSARSRCPRGLTSPSLAEVARPRMHLGVFGTCLGTS